MPEAAPLVVQQNLTTEDTFDKLYDAGALDTPDEAQARSEKPAKEPKGASVPEDVAPAPVEEPEAPAEPATDAEALATEEAKEQGEEVDAQADEKAYASLDEYLKDSKIDAESFKALPVEVKVDGQSKVIPLRDVIKGYQLEQHTQLKSLQIAEERRGFEQEQTNVRQALRQQAEQSMALFNLAQQQMLGEYQQINWQELRAQDPGRAALLYNDFQGRQAQISAHLQQLTSSKETEAKRAQEDHARTLPQEREKLMQARPEWKDPKAYEAARQAMFSTAKAVGLTDEELGQLTDHRYAILLDKAARFDALQASKAETLKKVRLAPQMLRPGSRQERDPKAVRTQQVKDNFLRNPKNEDAGAAYFEQFV